LEHLVRTGKINSVVVTTGMVAATIVLAGCKKSQTPTSSSAAPANNAADVATNTIATNNPVLGGAEGATAAAAGPTAAAAGSGFKTVLAMSDLYEIAVARVARRKAADTAAKIFAAKMFHDHTQSTAGLKKAIATGAVTAILPIDIDERRKGLIENLRKAAKSDFDKAYFDQPVVAHEDAISPFNAYHANGDKNSLTAFAAKTEPVVRSNLDMARQIHNSLD
jgi:putative membrane protein